MTIAEIMAELDALRMQWDEEDAARAYTVDFDRLHAEAVEWVEWINPMTIEQRVETVDGIRVGQGLPPIQWPEQDPIQWRPRTKAEQTALERFHQQHPRQF